MINYQDIPSYDIYDGMYINQSTLNEKYPGKVRNIGVESYLIHQKIENYPEHTGSASMLRNEKQKKIVEKEINRFTPLPYNPQDTRHIVWSDNMPRGGYSTRNDKTSEL